MFGDLSGQEWGFIKYGEAKAVWGEAEKIRALPREKRPDDLNSEQILEESLLEKSQINVDLDEPKTLPVMSKSCYKQNRC
jgi:hypothetical protein